MKKIYLGILLTVVNMSLQAQVTGSFVVKGLIGNYYPVLFTDVAWNSNVATEMTLGRSGVHDDASWRGAFIAKFRFHADQWGNGASFIDADMRENTSGSVAINNFIGGWLDLSLNNSNAQVVIWLRGGTTTYFYTSNYAVNPIVYDGITNILPLQVQNGGPLITFKPAPDSYVNVNGINVSAGISTAGNLSATGAGSNYFTGPIAIGTTTPGSNKLAVEGNISARKVIVTAANPFPDYVFDSTYRLAPLASVEKYIRASHHLPEISSADSVAKNGLDLGNNQVVLLKKIEELTLYAIEQQRQLEELRNENKKMGERLNGLEATFKK